MVYQDIADSTEEGVRTDMIIIGFSQASDLVSNNRQLTKIAATSVDVRAVSCMGKGIPLRMFTESE